MTTPLCILALDPGTKHTGYAVMRHPEALVTYGTFTPKTSLRGVPRQAWIISKIQDLITEYRPHVLALEEFVWREGEREERYVTGRDGMCKLVGALETLSLFPPYPMLYEMLPQRWGAQLVGSRQHTKLEVAHAVNLRLGTAFDGSYYTNHASDAVGIALIASDMLRQQAYIAKHGTDQGKHTTHDDY